MFFTRRGLIALTVVAAAVGMILAMPGVRGREWWLMPPLTFLAIILLMGAMGKRRRITPAWIAMAAGTSVLIGVFLWLT